ncbi:Vtc4 protein [Saccharomycopsis crataegensis]|uniref:Vacuolar transporter chaperone complex subunit 4 n=1 Tax=Saccharomycopsis crataegensis TaxID=43959 RepID=A0AAV5QGT2_9ASCO|nr:Vtc4 protein [Saccharomycopsis crataegensis]
MKFGEHLKSSLIKDFNFYYIAYDDLKYQLKKGLNKNDDTWSSDLEEQFLTSLESELDKVYSFTVLKKGEIQKRIKSTEKLVNEVVEAVDSDHPPLEEDFLELEDELSDIIADTHDLAKFTKLNYTGFHKIIKKHDKQTKFHLKPIFQARLDSKPFFKDNYDNLIVKLSKLYDLVRTRGNPVIGDSAAGGKQQNFVRQTTKYWVHPDNVTELKLIILKHLPVLVFNSNKEFSTDDSAITSIYFDNSKMDLYYGRLRKDEGAEAHRLRWYGNMKSDTIFFERKTHREDWTGESSVKQRFSTKEKHVNDFIKGEYTVPQAFEKMRKEGKKSRKEIENLEALASEIQYAMIKRKLRPVMRSFYHRTAFQLPGDARVRISLDTELSLVREDNFDGHDRTNGNWRRTDIGIDWPFNQLDDKDICRFPYAVLEVKLQTQLGQEPPQWIRDLIASHLVEAVPKFSKFIHGCASLLPEKVDLIPFWLPQMDVDIRKPKLVEGVGIQKIHHDNNSDSNHATAEFLDEEELLGGNYQSTNSASIVANVGGDSESSPLLINSYSARKVNTNGFSLVPKFIRDYFDDDREYKIPQGTVFETRIKAPPGKQICVPVRIEPKVYFATERTFLSWLSIAMVLGATATTLLSYGGSGASLVSSIGFFVSAILTIIYATVLYIWRVYQVREKKATDYTDRVGPAGICGLLMISTFLTFVFKYTE